MSDLILMGGGGHCRSAIDVIEAEGSHKIIGVLEQSSYVPSEVLGYPVLGTDDDLSRFVVDGAAVLVTVGQIKTADIRVRAFIAAKIAGASQPAIVMHGAVVNAGCEIGENCIVNSMALVEHDVVVGDHTHIATGARVNGGVTIGPRCFIGSGAVLHNDIEIGEGAIIPAGALVRSSVSTTRSSSVRERGAAHG